ncbi:MULTISPECIES: hypothetical protein [unclassified Mesorhizobium]|uniref:hypothetical protein n=1 Tax=unclassified Mesorhizobium TaxID=325217 RepID=UPI000FCC78C5|nr:MULTISPECIES: hypothetical protein [unclassified Mesorhizobium]TGP22338.1 hypothetical protein EN874_019705 [Mesorhizobium sp. M1D.F.Ca.ET.231.01.1.1]TGP24692.1 hypothetical protein EN877_30490 [Mesorhizobium sp. M1D.F.Ca.ET.234.01.1.1]TGS37295.1 hypothetical protein EN827_30795 [Mesorhizobium sp. M1D.F.Ca.ET.184.01.1.1]TGS58095.1 hypothetical protein EN826_030770 [Mesorhizobium sp. M1D.F.Ca.ET.183.01.1.1]
MSIEDAPEGILRAWADAGVISSARYVEEMERRRGAARQTVEPTPPLDYALDRELDIPGIAVLDFVSDQDDGIPNPRPGAWLVFFFVSTVLIAGGLIWRILP